MALTVGSRLGHYDVTALIVRVLRAGPNSLWGGEWSATTRSCAHA